MQAYKETLTYLDSLTNYEKTGFGSSPIRFDLEKLRKVLREINNPQEKYKVIHIAGTKGKGSVSTITASILKEAGYKVGLYTSPHLITPRERISINDDIIAKKTSALRLMLLKGHLEIFRKKLLRILNF